MAKQTTIPQTIEGTTNPPITKPHPFPPPGYLGDRLYIPGEQASAGRPATVDPGVTDRAAVTGATPVTPRRAAGGAPAGPGTGRSPAGRRGL